MRSTAIAAAVAAVFLLAGCAAPGDGGAGAESAAPTPTPTPDALVVDWPLLSDAMPADDAFADWGWAASDVPSEPMAPTECAAVIDAGLPASPTLVHERSWVRDGADGEESLYIAARHYAGESAAALLDAEARAVDCPPAQWELDEGIIRIHAEASETTADLGDGVLAYRQVYESDYARLHQEAVIVACGEVVITTSQTAFPARIDPGELAEWAGIVFDAADGLEGQC